MRRTWSSFAFMRLSRLAIPSMMAWRDFCCWSMANVMPLTISSRALLWAT